VVCQVFFTFFLFSSFSLGGAGCRRLRGLASSRCGGSGALWETWLSRLPCDRGVLRLWWARVGPGVVFPRSSSHRLWIVLSFVVLWEVAVFVVHVSRSLWGRIWVEHRV
jgi:hypothetical protein